jgi:integrase
MQLTDTAVKNAKPKPDGKAAKHTDGGGLYLWVTKEVKSWRYDYARPVTGKRNTLVIGTYPEFKLKEARERHQAARDLLARGVDPSEYKQSEKAAERALTANSFEAVAREWFVKFSPQWVESHSSKIIRRFERDIFPWIGSRPIGELEPPDILQCLRRIESRGALETAHRAKQDIGQVFRYAVATGRATRDQTADLKGAIPPPKKRHFAAITEPQEVGQLLRAIQDYNGTLETRIALQLAPYLFTRPGELRQMEWAEIDTETAVWEIPAGKMKMKAAHIVPLPCQAVVLLEEIRPLTGNRRYVFPSRTDSAKPMSDNTLRQALRRLGYDNEAMTPHGFRAMARTILDEELEIDEKYIEQQLAHAVKDPNGRAYNRTKHLKQRTAMMQRWADYLDGLRSAELKIK